MGVKNLNSVLCEVCPNAFVSIKLDDLKGKIVAIDGTLWFYQIMCAIRKENGDLLNSEGKNTTMFYSLLNRLLFFLKNNIKPIVVFDGKPSSLKSKTLESRKANKSRAEEKIRKNEFADDIEKGKLLQKATRITQDDIVTCKRLLNILGIPFIDSPEESDGQLAYLSKNNLVDYVITDDSDIVVFGARKVINGFKITKTNYNVIDMDLFYSSTNISQNDLAKVSILLGCDYFSGVKGYGKKRVVKAIETKEIEIPESTEDIVDYFINPVVQKNVSIKFRKPNLVELIEFLRDDLELTNQQMNATINKVSLIIKTYF